MITVFGSINADISVAAARLPAPGETVLGGAALLSPGGKGANQAHAARRFGAGVRMFGAVGSDAFAPGALQSLADAGVDITGVAALAGQATGLALIVLDAQGENSIVVAPGANLAARAADLPDQVLRDSGALLLQLETDAGETMALARRARGLGCRVILNASPLDQADLLDMHAIDTLIVNRDELQQLAQRAGVYSSTADALALALARRYANEVLVTLGAQGALLAGADGSMLTVPAFPVQAADTTGAGDTFAGVFAAAIAEGAGRQRAMEYGGAAAALACSRRGAQVAQPLRTEIEQLLASRRTAQGQT
jgi:ribokinase